MSLLPEYIFQAILIRGIRTIREDSRFLDQLFRNLDQESQNELRTFIRTQAIDLTINYPREPLKLPAIVILLKAETESQAYLGDSMGTRDMPPAMFSYAGELEGELLGGVGSAASLTGVGELVFGPYRASGGTANTLTISSREWLTSTYITSDHEVRTVAGTGAGQVRSIVANGENVLMVSPNWATIPDTTTVFEIRQLPSEVIGQPSSLYNSRNPPTLERRGSLYALSYQVQIIGPNPEMTIYLAAIVKFILTLSRTFLEGQGIINMKMGATDFVPRTEYQPDFAYMRALNVDFLYPFDIFEELGDLATQLQIVLEGCPINVGDAKVTLSSTITPIGPDSLTVEP